MFGITGTLTNVTFRAQNQGKVRLHLAGNNSSRLTV
jgi:hypothetical protein